MNEEQIRTWIERDPDPNTRAEIEGFLERGDHEALVERFLTRLAFGTAGLRGVVGAGPNRMNRLVVIETSLGFGRVVAAQTQGAAVVVAYDGRTHSERFARDAASAFASLGLRVHFFGEPMPTPVAAFAIKELKAAAGVVITASHNPPEYNGYKAFGRSAAQIVPPLDTQISEAIDAVAGTDLPFLDFDDLRVAGSIVEIDRSMAERYLDSIARHSIHPADTDRGMPIAYTPLHGVGAKLAEHAMTRAGFTRFESVAEQREPDPGFPTVRFPNPEEPGAMDRVIEHATAIGAEIAFANDPDADRLAVAIRDDDRFRVLTGDEIGLLLGQDRLQRATKPAVVGTTIVSSTLLGAIAKAHGAECFETLTGFKWIAQEALKRKEAGQNFVFGYEEALGYTIGDHVRDKDGIIALVAFAEMFVALGGRGRDVLDALYTIYRTHGVVVTLQQSLKLAPDLNIGRKLRRAPPARIGDRAVTAWEDFRSGKRTTHDGHETRLEFPPSDVLRYHLEGGVRVVVRPSGTEPKLKCYYLIQRAVEQSEPREVERLARIDLEQLRRSHQDALSDLFD
ncbi:MAG: phospho-sugar mutase [Myxococcota bacterium]